MDECRRVFPIMVGVDASSSTWMIKEESSNY